MKGLIMIEGDRLHEFAKLVAGYIKEDIMKGGDDLPMTPKQLAAVLPALSENRIKEQIRKNCYGTRIGEKGKMVATVAEVKKYNRI